MTRTIQLLALFALLPTVPSAVQAQEPKQRARALFKRANELFSRGMYLDALRKYREARALYPSVKIDLNIGATLDALGRRTEAAAFIERFLVQSAAAPTDVIDAATARLEELRRKLARVKITTLVEGATLWVDNKAVGTTPMELPIYLEPGPHRLRLERKGHPPVSRALELAAGQQVSVDLTPRARIPASQPTATAPRRAAGDRMLQDRRRARTLWAYGTLAAGSVLVATAAVLYGVGASQGNAAHDSYKQATDPAEMDAHYEDVEAARSKLIAGHVLMGAGVAALGASVYLFLTRPRPEAPRVSLVAAPGGCALGLRGSF
jgi:tetratricopeptide (TPR) repeat protein